MFNRSVPSGALASCVLALTLLLCSENGHSQDVTPPAFGIGMPQQISDLPPGLFRSRLQSLSPQAQSRALEWLQRITFPEADLQFLRADDDGGIHYADEFLIEVVEHSLKAVAEKDDAPIKAEAIAHSEVFKLHSLPGSTNVLYLDFDGHSISGTAWNSGTADPLVARPYDPSGNDPSLTVADFSTTELDQIGEIWTRVAEDLAPFDIDVTTEEPATFTNTTGRVLITHDVDANNVNMPACCNAGGVAYVNVFGLTGSFDYAYYSPALVYYNKLGTHGNVAEASSHEFGHNIGMGHDGGPGTAYYAGHGTGLVTWAPIMGNSYGENVTQWSQGEYSGANNPQDDLALIASDLGYLADDHGNSHLTATAVTIEPVGTILVSDPEVDPHNVMPENKGVIGDRFDEDWWSLDVGTGALNIKVTPAWKAYNLSSARGANLDVELVLYESDGSTVVASHEPDDDTFAEITLASVNAGRYYISIDGVGNSVNSNYSDYNSMGFYYIEGSVAPAVIDTDPPDPDPTEWAVNGEPAAIDGDSVTMTAKTATDPSGVQYNFICVSGGAGCADSGWQDSTVHVATGLAPSTTYQYKVRAKDPFDNITGDSSTESATTDQDWPDPAFSYNCELLLCSFTDASTDSDGTVEDWSWDFGDSTTSTVKSPVHAFPSSGTYPVELTVTDDDGAFNTVNQNVSVSEGMTPASIDVRVSASLDDVEERINDGDVLHSSTDLDLIYDNGGRPDQVIGLRFNNIDVPKGVTITNAYIQFTTEQTDTGTTHLTFRAEDVDNAPVFSTTDAYHVTSRTQTSASVDWNNVPSWLTVGQTHDSPDLSPVVQEVVDRFGWSENNSMVFIITGNSGGKRQAWSFDGSPTAAPLLHIEYGIAPAGCTANRTIQANIWESFALPCNPGTANRVQDVFANLVTAGAVYDVDWFVWRYQVSNNTYYKMAANEAMVPGQAYWIYTLQPTTVNYTGAENLVGDMSMATNPATGLFNYAGHTENASKAWVDFKAAYSSIVATMPGADAWTDGTQTQTECGLATPSDDCLVSRTAYVWKNGNWQTFDALAQGLNDDVEASYGIFVKAFRPGVMLRIEDGPSAAPAAMMHTPDVLSLANQGMQADYDKKGDTDKNKKNGEPWVIRLIAEAGFLQDRSNILGQLGNAADGQDSNDIEELSPFGSRFISLTFDNEAFAAARWGHTTDYRALTDKPEGEWPFRVRASSDVEEITLSWEADKKVLNDAFLLDHQTGKKHRVKPGESYTFGNDNGESHFTFVLK